MFGALSRNQSNDAFGQLFIRLIRYSRLRLCLSNKIQLLRLYVWRQYKNLLLHLHCSADICNMFLCVCLFFFAKWESDFIYSKRITNLLHLGRICTLLYIESRVILHAITLFRRDWKKVWHQMTEEWTLVHAFQFRIHFEYSSDATIIFDWVRVFETAREKDRQREKLHSFQLLSRFLIFNMHFSFRISNCSQNVHCPFSFNVYCIRKSHFLLVI